MRREVCTLLNLLAFSGSSLVVIMAVFWQFYYDELPCALCNLQRLAFLLFGCGLLIVLLYPENYKKGYFLSGLSVVIGELTALTQVFVHIMPDVPPTGSAIFGIHMYGWTSIFFIAAVLYILTMQFVHPATPDDAPPDSARTCRYARQPASARAAILVFVAVCVICLLSAFAENGFSPFLAGGQQHYWITEVLRHPGSSITPDMLMTP